MKIGHLDIPDDADIHGTGLASWTNPHNSFRVLVAHYTADPDKRSLIWKRETSAGYTTPDWDQEYEISFKTWAGRPCFQSFSERLHISPEPLTWERGLPIIRGWDIGVHACVWAQRANARLNVYTARIVSGAFGEDENPARYKRWEIPVSGLQLFIRRCQEVSEDLFKGNTLWHDIVDPSAKNKTVRHSESPLDDFHDCGISPDLGVTQDIPMRISGVESWLASMTVDANGARPSFQVQPGELLLTDALAGAYRYDKEGTSPKPLKNGHSHHMDCLQYLCGHYPAPNRGSYYPSQEEKRDWSGFDPARFDVGAQTFSGMGGPLEQQEAEERERPWDSF